MSSKIPETIEGRFEHLIYSPRGEIEGVLLDVGGKALQLVFEHGDEAAGSAFATVGKGQTVVVAADSNGSAAKGGHAVADYVGLQSIDGVKFRKARPGKPAPAYQGKVVRFNYARHGAPNGVVLDTGDFVHTKPEGLARLKLKIGDAVQADGDAQMLVTGAGWVVEAATVNGKAVFRE